MKNFHKVKNPHCHSGFPLDGRCEAMSCKSFGVQFKCSVDAQMLQSPKPWDGCSVMTPVLTAAAALQSYVEVFK